MKAHAIVLALLLARSTLAAGVDLTLTITPTPPTLESEGPLALTVTVSNKGSEEAHGVRLAGTVPFNTTLAATVGPAWTCTTGHDAGAALSCMLPALQASATATVEFQLTLAERVSPDIDILGSFTITSDEPDTNCADNKASFTVPQGPYEGPLLPWLRKNVNIRRAYDGTSKDENTPANITWVGHDAMNGQAYWDVNIAIKVLNLPIGRRTPAPLLLYPVVEWHRQTTTSTPTNRGSGKLALEWFPLTTDDHTVVPFVNGNLSYTRDWEKDTWTTNATALVGVWSKRPWLPGALSRFASYTQVIRYYVYIGGEYYDKLPAVNSGPLTTFAARASMEWYWLSWRDQRRPLSQVLLQYAYRHRLSSNPLPSTMYLFVLEANVFLDRRGNIAFGYRYQRGEDPLKDFTYTEQSSVGLKVKF